MLSNILNIEGVSLLPKEQQKAINGGYVDTGCSTYHNGQVLHDWTVSDAQTWYNNNVGQGDDVRYCCASCHDRQWYKDSLGIWPE